jgi:hypothetical protein
MDIAASHTPLRYGSCMLSATCTSRLCSAQSFRSSGDLRSHAMQFGALRSTVGSGDSNSNHDLEPHGRSRNNQRQPHGGGIKEGQEIIHRIKAVK